MNKPILWAVQWPGHYIWNTFPTEEAARKRVAGCVRRGSIDGPVEKWDVFPLFRREAAVAEPTPSNTQVTPPPAAPGAGDPETILDAFGRAIVAYNDKVAAKADTRWAWEELMRARGSVLDRLRAIPPSPLVPAPLVWTRTKPKAEGWYFLRLPGTTSKQVERIIIDHEVGGIAKWYSDYEEDWEPVLEGREWAGPIPPPLDPKGPGEPKGEPEQSSYLDQIGAKSIQLEINRRMSENAEQSPLSLNDWNKIDKMQRAQEGGKA